MEYLSFFGLEKEPFKTGPSIDFFYRSPEHEECLARIMITIQENSGLFVAVGDTGTGKTSLTNIILSWLMEDDNNLVGLIKQPRSTSDFSFLEKVYNAFGVPLPEGRRSTLKLEDTLFKFIQTEGYENMKKIILLIDEAQEMKADQIRRVREFLNIETAEEKLINIIIFAQLEFLTKINTKKFKSFRQRVYLSYILNPLNLKDTKALINHRLKVAGLPDGKELFDDEAIGVIHKESKGLPRDICKFCHASLLSAYTQEKGFIDMDLVSTEIKRIPVK